jgi:hypothetical protein
MRKMTILAVALSLGLGLGAATWQRYADEVDEEKTIVLLSGEKWKFVKHEMDKKGICEIAEQNVVLVITNGLPEAKYFISTLLDEDRNFRRKDKKARSNNGIEPIPYP